MITCDVSDWPYNILLQWFHWYHFAGRGSRLWQKRDRFVASREHEMHEALLEPWWQWWSRASKKDLEDGRGRKRYLQFFWGPCSMMFHVTMTIQFCNLDTKIITIQGSSNSWLHTGTIPSIGFDSPGILCYNKLIYRGPISRTLDVGCVHFPVLRHKELRCIKTFQRTAISLHTSCI